MSKLIGEGGFGCVFHPGFNCNGKIDDSKNKEKYVSKIQKKDLSSEMEVIIGNKIKSISGFKLYFAPIINSCDVGLSKINTNVLSKCSIYEKFKHETSLSLFKLNYVKSVELNKELLRKGKKEAISTFCEIYRHILSGIELLWKHKIVHFDLKKENIIFDVDRGLPIIIDFGLSFVVENKGDMEDLYSRVFYVIAPEYYLWPLEVHFANMIMNGGDTVVLTVNDVKKLCDDYILNCKAFEIFSENFKTKYVESSFKFLSNYIGKKRSAVLKEIIGLCKTWDNYAVGIMNLRLLANMFNNGFTYNETVINISKVLIESCHPDPTRRPSVAETKKNFEQCFYTNDKSSGFGKMMDSMHVVNDELRKTLAEDDEHLKKTISNALKK